MAAASVVFTALNLEFESDRNALISPDLEWNKRFEDWRDSFPGSQDMYVVVDMGQVDFGASKEGRMARKDGARTPTDKATD